MHRLHLKVRDREREKERACHLEGIFIAANDQAVRVIITKLVEHAEECEPQGPRAEIMQWIVKSIFS